MKSLSIVKSGTVMDSAAAARQARFGALPERVRHEDLVEEKPVSARDAAGDAYNPEKSFVSYSCLALDLGL
ncbi:MULTISPECIES: hypothetical protein [unclassified Streptomyces]|uniref:hypothetical protein n=1 Tax=unclassified Streptomyces TaxID=2593676 RepID=UPI002E2C5F59|nr:hypothetical protein [Streptomyces sp. NBC_00223]